MASTGKYDVAPSYTDVSDAGSTAVADYNEGLRSGDNETRENLLDQAQSEGILAQEGESPFAQEPPREQLLEKLHEAIAEIAHKNTRNLQFYELPVREQQYRLVQLLSQYRSEYGLSDGEISSLRQTYSDALEVAFAERERESVQLIATASGRARQLARETISEPYDQARTTAQVRSDMEKLRVQFSGRLTREEWQQVSSAYLEERSQGRKEALFEEVRRAARKEARRSFDRDPSDGPNSERIRESLTEIAQSYADVENIASLESEIQQAYKSEYNRRHRYLYNNELNWFQRRYYDVKSWVSSAWDSVTGFAVGIVSAGKSVVNAVKSVGKAAIETVKFVGAVATNVVYGLNSLRKAAQQITKDIIVGAAKLSYNLTVGTAKLLANPKTWLAVGKGVLRAGKACIDANLAVLRFAGKAVVGTAKFITSPKTWLAVGKGVVAVARFGLDTTLGALKLAKNAIVGTAKFVTNPQNWLALGRGVVSAVKFGVDATVGALKLAKNIVVGTARFITNPNTWIAIGKGIVAVAKFNFHVAVGALKLAKNIVVGTAKFLTSPDTWKAIGRGIYAAGKFAIELPGKALSLAKSAVVGAFKFATNIENWKALGNGLLRAGKFVADLPRMTIKGAVDAVRAVAGFIADPQKWSAIGRGIVAVAQFLKDPNNWTAIGDGILSAWDKIKDPQTWKNALKTLNAIREGVQQVVVDAIVGTAGFIKDVSTRLWNVVTDPATYKAIWNGACRVCSGIRDAVVNTAKFLTDPETWKALGRGIKAGWDFVTSPETWKSIGKGLQAAWDFATDPKTWKAIGGALETAWNAVSNPENWKAIGAAALGLFTDPVGTAKWLWNASGGVRRMLKGMCDTMGITDLAVGLWSIATIQFAAIGETVKTALSLARDIGKVLVGQMSAADLKRNLVQNIKKSFGAIGQKFSEGLRAIKGGILVLGELTGITDCVLTVKYALQGNWMMAGIHAGFALMSAGSIAATIATAGTAAGSILGVMTLRTSVKDATKTILKAAAKNFFEDASQQIGKAAIKELEGRLGKEAFDRMLREGAVEIADQGSRELAERILREGSEVLTHELVEETMYKSSKEITERVLREAGLVEVVDDLVFQLLKSCDGQSVKGLAKQLQKMGMAEGRTAARALAKEIKHLVRHGGADDAIKQILHQGISKEIRRHVEGVMEHAFKNRFRKALKGELVDELGEKVSNTLHGAVCAQAKRWKKGVDDLIEEFVESGWKGVKRGIKEAVEKLVREGIERAFKRFRAGKGRVPHRMNLKRQVVRAPIRANESEEIEEMRGPETTIHESNYEDIVQCEDRAFKYSKTVVVGNCEYTVLYQLEEDGNWHEVNATLTRMINEPDKNNRLAHTTPASAFYSQKQRERMGRAGIIPRAEAAELETVSD